MANQPQGTGFVGLQQYLTANQDTVNNNAQQITNAATAPAQAAETLADQLKTSTMPGQDYTNDPGYQAALQAQTNAQAGINNLGNAGGIATALQAQYGKRTRWLFGVWQCI